MGTEIKEVMGTEAVQQGKPLGWGKVLLFIVAFYGISALLGIVVGIVLAMVDAINGTNLAQGFMEQLHYLMLLDAVAFLITVLIFKSVRQFLKGVFSFSPLKKGKTYLYLVAGFVLLFAAQYLIMNVLHWEDGSDQINTFGVDKVSFGWVSLTFFYLAYSIVTPIKEEVLFRGVLHGFLDKKFNFWAGLIVSSVIFGSLHVGHILSAALMGVVLVLLYKFTRSLIVPILFHIIWNLYAVTGLLLFVSQNA